jgi:hypothetical protein
MNNYNGYFENWAVVGYKDNTGIGNQVQYVKQTLRVGSHIIFPSKRLSQKECVGVDEIVIGSACTDDMLKDILSNFYGIVVIERNKWHENLLEIANDLHLKIILIPNWEWFDPNDAAYGFCSAIACPNEFSRYIIQKFGFNNTFLVPPPVRLKTVKRKNVQDKATIFIHNAGIVDSDDRKGTILTIKAFIQVDNPNIKLYVRAQKEFKIPFNLTDDRVCIQIKDFSDNSSLYEVGDVAIQPSKMEGIGYNILEPTILGMPVITTNYPPMSGYGNGNLLVEAVISNIYPYPKKRGITHAHLVEPNLEDIVQKIVYCSQNSVYEHSIKNISWSKKNINSIVESRAWMKVIKFIEHE